MTEDPRKTASSGGSEDSPVQGEPVVQPPVPAKTITTKAVFDRSTTQTISLSDVSNLESESGTEQEVVPTEAAKETSGFPLKMVAVAVVPLAVAAFAIFGLGGGADETITAAEAVTPTESTAAAPQEVPTTAPTDAPPSTTSEAPTPTTSEAPIALASAETTTTSILETTTTSILETTTSSILEPGAPFNCAENQGPVTPQLVVANIPADDPDGGLNIRDGVSVSAEILITTPNGTAFTHIGGCEVVANGDVWWQVSGEEITGWANSKYFTS